MKRIVFFSLIVISNLLFLMNLPLNDNAIQMAGLILLSIPNVIILLMAIFVKPCKKNKYWGIGTVALQIVIVLLGLSRDYFYTMGFKASNDKPILFVQQEESWGSSIGGRSIKTVYSDGTVHWFSKDLHDFVAFWVREKCDTTTIKWVASTDTMKMETYSVTFDLSNKTYHTTNNWGKEEITEINWDLLQEIANKENKNSKHIYFQY